jgi:hypothetical protein
MTNIITQKRSLDNEKNINKKNPPSFYCCKNQVVFDELEVYRGCFKCKMQNAEFRKCVAIIIASL